MILAGDFSAGSMGGNGRTKTPYQQEPQNIIGLVAFLLLGVAAVFISFAVVALCYRLVETECYCNLQTRPKVVDRKCLLFTDTQLVVSVRNAWQQSEALLNDTQKLLKDGQCKSVI